jgi:predicted nucleic acid-binding protein
VTLAYLDASAFVKTVALERETDRLQAWLRSRPDRASSALLRTEALRAAHRYGVEAVARARDGLRRLKLLALDDAILDAAGDLPVDVRSLDAIHLATALALGTDLGVLVTYDERMARAAAELGLATAAP